MTSAPPALMQARAVLLDHLDMHPGNVAADLDPNEVGIVGDPAHRGGYHCGKDRCDWDDYSVRESARDRAGFSDYASALDVGEFDVTTPKGRFNLRHFSAWLVGECQRGAADTLDIREVIYTLDGKNVKRWDRLGKRSTGDSSHLFHTHISEFRDARGRHMVALMTRYLTTIGLITTGALMALTDAEQDDLYRRVCNMDSAMWYGQAQGKDSLPDIRLGFGEGGKPGPQPYALMKLLNSLAGKPAAAPVELTDEQLDALADKVAAKLGGGTIALSGTYTPADQA